MSDDQAAAVEAYIAGFPAEVADRLRRVRAAILSEVPDPQEKMRYGIAAVMLGDRYALHYAGWKKHIGLYPVPVLPDPIESEIASRRSGKDSVVLPHSEPIDDDLIRRITAAVVVSRSGR